MIDIGTLASYCNQLLDTASFKDYCPNGLQVEGDRPVRRLVYGVTASQALIDAAIARDADVLLVHHGYFWRGEDPCLVGMKGRRVRALMRHGMSLLAYHLPLDAHPELGNNRALADALGIVDAEPTAAGDSPLWRGRLEPAVPAQALAALVGRALGREPLCLPGHQREIRQIAWCTGAAQGYIEQAATLGVDAYLSGEVSEQTTHTARELGVTFLAAGHHATERYGVRALAGHLAERFGIAAESIEVENPV